MTDYEKLGAFYLGRRYDAARGQTTPEMLLYDAKDLTTHAVCVGMTGSGKTGLCLGLIEEAAIDGIPVLAIDPKGDLGNLMLTFPKLRAEDFAPWIDPGEATRKGVSQARYATQVADLWRKGLADWGQTGKRIQRLKDSAEVSIYTPGSQAGLPIRVLRSLAAPPQQLLADGDLIAERVQSSVSGLLTLLGRDADPLRSREHILMSNILDRAWRDARDLEIADLIREIQAPPFKRVGVLDLESFYPGSDRFELAMSLNGLLASPAFANWMEGEPLDVQRLMWTEDGRPRVSILSIAHLSEDQRMFFVTTLLNEVLAWVRSQPGTSSLRALLYMDEVFGYFPPVANPPSKRPMLTLLKQARAYGLGCVLATQNPVDLDYKGLSNTGTWFLGRLQTERDKARVLEGLEGASIAAGSEFNRARMDQLLSGLGKRVFLMNNVHDDGPTLFHTRWVMSYLRGPLTRSQIQDLMADRKRAAKPTVSPGAAAMASVDTAAAPPAKANDPDDGLVDRPVFQSGVLERHLPLERPLGSGDRLVYRPALLARGQLHFASARDRVDEWRDFAVLAALLDEVPSNPWENAVDIAGRRIRFDESPNPDARYTPPPGKAARASSYKTWTSRLKSELYKERRLPVWKCSLLKEVSEPGETEGDFRARLRHAVREHRDGKVEKLRRRYGPKLARLQERIRTAEQKVQREKAQVRQQSFQTAVSVGTTLLGALFGRKKVSAGTVGRAATAARGAGRVSRERGDVARAKATMKELQRQLADLEREFAAAVSEVQDSSTADDLELKKVEVRPRKSDTDVGEVALVWTPWDVGADGIAEALALCTSPQ